MVTAWRNRIVGQGEEAPDQLVANPLNWRTHPGSQRDALRGSLATVGWVQQVLVNRQTGNVVDGHARVEEALSRGENKVPVLYVDLDPDEERLVLASLDPIGAMAVADNQKLEELLADLQSGDEGLDALLRELAPPGKVVGLTDPDDAPDLGEETHIKRGDLFALGDHRVMCGDATDETDVARVLDGAKPNLTVTDPPYGVNYDPAWRNRAADKGLISHAARRVGAVMNDDRADWEAAYRLFPGDVAYVWHAGVMPHVALLGLEAAGFEIRGQIIWAKTSFAISRGHYNGQHEPCWYAVRKGANASWVGSHSESTLWECGWDQNVAGGHSTQKPVEVMEHPIRNHRGDVYDPFLGSGTTVIAAEQTGRHCYGMEIDPRYVAVTIARWENFTGNKAERL